MLCTERCLATAPSRGSGASPASSAATAFFWLGMITANTLNANERADQRAGVDQGAAGGEDPRVAPRPRRRPSAKTTQASTTAFAPALERQIAS